MKTTRTRLQTNLLGRKVHLLTDEEASEEARKHTPPLEPDLLENLTAESWYPALKQYRQRFGDHVGEIVAVHLSDKDDLVYTIAFNGQLLQIMPALWRLDEPGVMVSCIEGCGRTFESHGKDDLICPECLREMGEVGCFK